NKFNNAINAHQGTVRVSAVPAERFDYESELVIVMGRKARNVSEAEALSYVFGYCIGHDFTARDLQSRSSQWMIGKTCDGFGLLGPYLVTADQIPDPNNLKIEGTVNGEVRQSSNTSDMVHNCATIISYASTLMTLLPGDVIYTGTPEGVIAGYPKEKQVWLKAGDRLTTTIEKLGTLQLLVDGQPPRTLKAGEVFFVPAGVVHDGKNVGKGKAVVLATYVVEKGKPVATAIK